MPQSLLSDLLSEERNLRKSVVANWVKLKVYFALTVIEIKPFLSLVYVAHEQYVVKHQS